MLCPGEILFLEADSGYVSYMWQNGSTNPSIVAGGPGWYAVTVTDACNFEAVDSLLISPDAPQGVSLGADTVICQGDQIVLSADPGFSTYLWQDNSTGASFTATAPGTYWVQVTNSAGCAYVDTIVISLCVGVTENAAHADVRLFPNPARDRFVVEIEGLRFGENVTVEMYNALGQTVRAQGFVGERWKMRKAISMNGMADGRYWIVVRFGEERFVKGLMKAE